MSDPSDEPTHLLRYPGDRHSLCGIKDARPEVWERYAAAHVAGHGMIVCADCLPLSFVASMEIGMVRVMVAARKIDERAERFPVHFAGCVREPGEESCSCGVADLVSAVRAVDDLAKVPAS